jgi:glutamyl-tRNA(Gln) amidotransferase subunit E
MLEKYGLEKHFDELRKELKAANGDTLIIVSGDEETSRRTLEAITERVNQLLVGIPGETRKALIDGNTEYLRPIPGAARMYPETDIIPIIITNNHLAEIRKNLPETWDSMIKRFMKKYKLNNELARQVVNSGLGRSFEEIAGIGVDPKLVASTITQGLKDLKSREAVPIEEIRDGHVLETFRAFKAGRIQKQSILAVLAKCARNPDEDMVHVIKGFESRGMTEDDVRKIVLQVIKEKPQLLKKDRPEKVYMGLVMARVRGKAPGNVVMKVLSEEIKRLI